VLTTRRNGGYKKLAMLSALFMVSFIATPVNGSLFNDLFGDVKMTKKTVKASEYFGKEEMLDV
jgi:hypothetical protein